MPVLQQLLERKVAEQLVFAAVCSGWGRDGIAAGAAEIGLDIVPRSGVGFARCAGQPPLAVIGIDQMGLAARGPDLSGRITGAANDLGHDVVAWLVDVNPYKPAQPPVGHAQRVGIGTAPHVCAAFVDRQRGDLEASDGRPLVCADWNSWDVVSRVNFSSGRCDSGHSWLPIPSGAWPTPRLQFARRCGIYVLART